MNAREMTTELDTALAELDRAKARIESVRAVTRAEMARQNTAETRALLERRVPEHLRENELPLVDKSMPPAMQAFARARIMLRQVGLLPEAE